MNRVKFSKKQIDPKLVRRSKRKLRIRSGVRGTALCPRLSVYRSNRHLFVQAVDDVHGNTLCSVSSYEKDLKEKNVTVDSIISFGKVLVGRLKEKNIQKVVFDRNGYKYHGIVKAFADSVRANGIVF